MTEWAFGCCGCLWGDLAYFRPCLLRSALSWRRFVGLVKKRTFPSLLLVLRSLNMLPVSTENEDSQPYYRFNCPNSAHRASAFSTSSKACSKYIPPQPRVDLSSAEYQHHQLPHQHQPVLLSIYPSSSSSPVCSMPLSTSSASALAWVCWLSSWHFCSWSLVKSSGLESSGWSSTLSTCNGMSAS
jgi:hypothetical protein